MSYNVSHDEKRLSGEQSKSRSGARRLGAFEQLQRFRAKATFVNFDQAADDKSTDGSAMRKQPSRDPAESAGFCLQKRPSEPLAIRVSSLAEAEMRASTLFVLFCFAGFSISMAAELGEACSPENPCRGDTFCNQVCKEKNCVCR